MVGLIIIALMLAGFAFWRFFFFFRNPRRVVPINESHILAPADGRVIYIRKVTNDQREPILSIKGKNLIKLTDLMHVDDPALQGRTGYLIGIFMSPFDVHYNRAPIRGTIHKIAHDFPRSIFSKRENLGMYNAVANFYFGDKPYYQDCDYLIHNERASYVIKREGLALYVTQIAERWVHRILSFKDDNQSIEQGEVFGLIRMGSQVDLFLPECDRFKIKVTEGERVRAGLSVIAELTQ